jgi:cyclohexanecarboxylate-CoA ligase
MITSPAARIEALTRTGKWGRQTLHSLLDQHTRERPDTLAICDQPDREALTGEPPRRLSWQDLSAAADNLARQLQGLGISENDCVLVQMPNVSDLVVSYYALSKLGAIVSPVPVQYSSHELNSMAGILGAQTLLTVGRYREQQLAAAAREALPAVQVLSFGRELIVDTSPGDSFPAAHADANRILTICWTSGTTGTPKGVPRSHNMWLATARTSAQAGDYRNDDVLLNPFPLVNMAALGGFLFPAALYGSSIVLHHPLDPPLFLQQMQDEKVSFTIAPPALLKQLAKSPDLWHQFDFSALRCIGSGSAPLAPWMIEVFDRDYDKQIVNFYGSNEGISLFATPVTAPAAEVRACMFPRPGPDGDITTCVRDSDSGDITQISGARGELLIDGATVFDGYYAHDNSDVFDETGMFRTGDLVEICGESGDCYKIVGRCKDIINRGGIKISPSELDLALEKYPGLGEAAVCAYPDERLGEKICACLVLAPQATAPSLEALQHFMLEQGFARYKLPERVELFEQLPRNPMGKVQRFTLQDEISLRIKEHRHD